MWNLSLSSFVNNTQNSNENYKPFWRLPFGRGSVVCPPSTGEWLRNIQHSLRMLLNARFHIWFIMTLYYNCDRYYYKMRQLFCYKMRQKFITKCVRIFITKCDNFVTKCDRCYKLRRFYYKMRQLLQNATFITNCDST